MPPSDIEVFSIGLLTHLQHMCWTAHAITRLASLSASTDRAHPPRKTVATVVHSPDSPVLAHSIPTVVSSVEAGTCGDHSATLVYRWPLQ